MEEDLQVEVGFSLLVLLVVLGLVFFMALFWISYWVVRLAIRHEKRRRAGVERSGERDSQA